MAHKRTIIAVTVLLVIGVVAWSMAAGQTIEQRGVLSGSVLPNGLVAVGATAREGDILVYVETITGPAAAVRANVDGTVREVLVRPGNKVRTGDVLVRIEPFKK